MHAHAEVSRTQWVVDVFDFTTRAYLTHSISMITPTPTRPNSLLAPPAYVLDQNVCPARRRRLPEAILHAQHVKFLHHSRGLCRHCYCDDDHPSVAGARMLAEEIIALSKEK